MMKRYNFRSITSRMNESVNGEWVKYEDVEELKAENTRLKEAFRQVKRYACSMDINYLSKIYDVADEALGMKVETEDEWTNQLPSEEDWGEGE